jgi:hypothetical protein
MSDTLIRSLTPERLREIMQQAGYRVELAGDAKSTPVLRSATNGFGFEVRFANRFAGDQTGYADVSFLAGLRVQGKLPLEPINDWNNTRRFARLHLIDDLLLLDMDVSVLGGITPEYLRAQVEIWDRLVQELIPYLREALRRLSAANGADPGIAIAAPQPDQPVTAPVA